MKSSNLKSVPSELDRIRELSDEIASICEGNATIDQHIARAEEATSEAARIKAQLEELGTKRARIRGQAFVDGVKPDTAAFDAEAADLEKRSRTAREDGEAAGYALEALRNKRLANQEKLAQLQGERNELVLAHLNVRLQSSLDRYVAGLRALVPVIAEAEAIRSMSTHFGAPAPRTTSALTPDPREANVPLPTSMTKPNPYGKSWCPKILNPSAEESRLAHQALLNHLSEIGVLP